MSYCSLEEAFQSNITDNALPLSKQHGEESKLEKARLKSRKHSSKRSSPAVQEPSVIEPDRPAHRLKTAPELLGGSSGSSSISSYLIGASDPGEDYFPYPTGAGGEGEFDKQFLLEPNWYEQFNDRMPNQKAESPLVPGWQVDGKSTLYQEISPSYARTNDMKNHMDEINKKRVSTPAASTHDSDLRRRIDEIYQKMDQLDVSRAESNHAEIILFVMTGIFVLLMLDLLLKQGCRAMGTIASVSIPETVLRGGGAFSHPFSF
jgi:hypothetical protein